MKIEVLNHPDKLIFEKLVDGVRSYNFEHMGDETSSTLAVISRDESGRIVGGVSGRTIYKQFLIEVAWVSQELRRSGLGQSLMQRAETEAKARGCLAAQVDTLSFQAPGFYQKLGFEIVGTVTGVENSPDRFFLVKRY